MTRTALITGSTDPSGIGFTAAFLLAQAPYSFNVILSGRKASAATSAAEELRSRLASIRLAGEIVGTVHAIEMDVASASSIAAAVEELLGPGGPLAINGGSIDVLINNAGVGAPPGRGGKGSDDNNMFLQTHLTTAEDMIKVFSTNVAAVVQVTNAMTPLLARSSAPRIVNVSSARGSLSFGSSLEPARTGAMVYNTSKAALNMVTLMQSKNLPAHLRNVKINAASPGHVKTPFNNFTGQRTLEEGAAVYVHLATLQDDGPTGQLIGNHAPFSSDGSYVQIPW